uniref:High mobility group nucleosome-binding domain-containing protein 3 n=20 Tax=Neognathae TaxID=8825 RepID=A0A8C4TTP6_FALTI
MGKGCSGFQPRRRNRNWWEEKMRGNLNRLEQFSRTPGAGAFFSSGCCPLHATRATRPDRRFAFPAVKEDPRRGGTGLRVGRRQAAAPPPGAGRRALPPLPARRGAAAGPNGPRARPPRPARPASDPRGLPLISPLPSERGARRSRAANQEPGLPRSAHPVGEAGAGGGGCRGAGGGAAGTGRGQSCGHQRRRCRRRRRHHRADPRFCRSFLRRFTFAARSRDIMPKRKSPEGAEGKDAAKVTKQEPTRRSARLSAVFGFQVVLKPAPPKPEPKPRKTTKKEPGTKANKGAKGKKDEKQEAAKEGTTPSENGENKAEEAQKTESVGDKNE